MISVRPQLSSLSRNDIYFSFDFDVIDYCRLCTCAIADLHCYYDSFHSIVMLLTATDSRNNFSAVMNYAGIIIVFIRVWCSSLLSKGYYENWKIDLRQLVPDLPIMIADTYN